jgi:hypothetical protein
MPVVGDLVRYTDGSWIDTAAAELPALSSLPARRDARRSPAVLLQGWAHDLDVPGMRRGGMCPQLSSAGRTG